MTADVNAMITIKRSLVIPVFRNEENIYDLLNELNRLHHRLRELEVVFVVDGSPDQSGDILLDNKNIMNFSAQIVFHSRNFGSFIAIRTGLEFSRGDFIAVMAADLQEPLDLIQKMFNILETDSADVVFGQRTARRDSLISVALSNSYWWLYRVLVNNSIPPGGVDIFACNRRVSEAVLEISEPNSSLIAQLFWVGFRQKFVLYERRPRIKGVSSWSLTRRVRYMMDSILSFSDLPILLVMWVGFFGCLLSAAFGVFVVALRLLNLVPVPGYAAIALLVTFGLSVQLLVQGVMGAYLWRTFENTKRRPLRIVQSRHMRPQQHGFALGKENKIV